MRPYETKVYLQCSLMCEPNFKLLSDGEALHQQLWWLVLSPTWVHGNFPICKFVPHVGTPKVPGFLWATNQLPNHDTETY